MKDLQGNIFTAPFTTEDLESATPSARVMHDNGFTAVAVESGLCARCGRVHHGNIMVGGLCEDCYGRVTDEDNGGGSLVCPSCGEQAWNDNDVECWACGQSMSPTTNERR